MSVESHSAILAPRKRCSASQGPQTAQALTRAQSERLSRWLVLHQNLVRRCWSGKASPRQAIKCQCLDCVGEDRPAIAECRDRCCPLWRFRPFQTKAENSAHRPRREEAMERCSHSSERPDSSCRRDGQSTPASESARFAAHACESEAP
jgi:hypothetical protein